MKTEIHKSETRGGKSISWLNSYHTFSFSEYYDPTRMNFGVLRVLNDDTVAPGAGFGTHPHSNMEIISIPLEGDLEHRDSMGTASVIKQGEIQVMSAGTGVTHSEHNHSSNEQVKFLQIWVIPNKQNVEPRYDQQAIADLAKPNEFYQILSPNKNDAGVWIHQNAWFSMADLKADVQATYELKNSTNGVYAFVIDGAVKINGEQLNLRDGMQITQAVAFDVTATSNAKVLLMEVPMSL